MSRPAAEPPVPDEGGPGGGRPTTGGPEERDPATATGRAAGDEPVGDEPADGSTDLGRRADDRRRRDLERNLAAVEARIDAACVAAGRPRGEVTLVVVTKTWPASDVRALVSLGVRDVGENRDQEAAPKAQACRDLDLRWHFVGQLQTNKTRSVAEYADWVHSVDRPRLVRALAEGARRWERTLTCLVQVALDDDPTRGGARGADVLAVADAVAAMPDLRLGGVMAVAPLDADPAAAFGRLAEIAARLVVDHPEARAVSAGMSGDLEAAVAAGATHLRVGTAVLGSRPPLR